MTRGTDPGPLQAPGGEPGRSTALARLLAAPVRAYRLLLSPLLPARCRFAPTCSSYALEALGVHGARRGLWLAVRRLTRCHPFCAGGHDPVPAARSAVGDDAVRSPPALGSPIAGCSTPSEPGPIASRRTGATCV